MKLMVCPKMMLVMMIYLVVIVWDVRCSVTQTRNIYHNNLLTQTGQSDSTILWSRDFRTNWELTQCSYQWAPTKYWLTSEFILVIPATHYLMTMILNNKLFVVFKHEIFHNSYSRNCVDFIRKDRTFTSTSSIAEHFDLHTLIFQGIWSQSPDFSYDPYHPWY